VDVDYGPIWLTEQIKKGNKRAYLAQDGDAIVGYVLYGPPICGVSFADWLAVDKKYQKQGIATRLLAKWEQDVLKDGAHNIHLWTWDFDVPFYRNRQFQQAGILPKAWCGFDCHLMYKILREPEEKNYLKKYLRKIKKG